MGQLAHLVGGPLRLLERLLHELPCWVLVRELLARELERDDDVDESLQRSVVQVAHHPPLLLARVTHVSREA